MIHLAVYSMGYRMAGKGMTHTTVLLNLQHKVAHLLFYSVHVATLHCSYWDPSYCVLQSSYLNMITVNCRE